MKIVKAKYLGKINFKELEIDQEFDLIEDRDLLDDVRVFSSDNDSTMHYYEPIQKEGKKHISPGVYQSSINRYGDLVLAVDKINLDKSFGGIELQNEIQAKCDTFFEKVDLYRKLGIKPRRGFCFWGNPGNGKTFVVNNTVDKLLKKGDTIVLKFDTTLRISALAKLLAGLEPDNHVKKICLILEDIGGGEVDPESGPQAFSDTSLLSFLDGNSYHLDLPLVIFATTNYPQNMLANLIDRPGRFDDVIEVLPPNTQVKAEFMESLLERSLTDIEKSKITKNHSMAHVKEAVVRHLVFNEDLALSLVKLTEHSEKVANKFNKESKMGF